MKIAIITEGIKTTGYGHLTRCLSLYQAFKEKKITPLCIAHVDRKGKRYLGRINLCPMNWTKKYNELIQKIRNYDVVIIDSYIGSLSLYKKICAVTKIAVYIDDFIRLNYPRGIIINGTINAEKLPYAKTEQNKYLLGVKYIPIRKEFWDIELEQKNICNNKVLITLGGQDIRKLTNPLLDFLKKRYPELKYNVIVGNGIKKGKKTIGVKYYYSLSAGKVRNLMRRCNFAISAAGQTLYELQRLQVPTIAIGVADNQKNNIMGWINAGWINEELWYDQVDLFERLAKQISVIQKKQEENMPRICDGQGARRIIKYILKVMSEDIEIREANITDARKIFSLSNDDTVRMCSISKEKIIWDDHLIWLKKMILEEDYKIYLFFLKNHFIGQVKFAKENNNAVVSISIVEKYRGCGFAVKMLNKGIDTLKTEKKEINKIIAYIKDFNISSISLFAKCGFKYMGKRTIKNDIYNSYILK